MRTLLMILALTAVTAAAWSQEKEKETEKLDINRAGFRFDINSSTVVGGLDTDTTRIGAKTGFSAGIFYREALGGIFGGQVEVRYIQMGFMDKELEVETNLNYIRLGAQFKLYPLTSKLGANAFFGFEYGLLVDARQQNPANKDELIDLNKLDIYTDGDYGIHGGVGLDFDFGLTTDVRIYLGLANIRENGPSARNLSAQFHLGWGF